MDLNIFSVNRKSINGTCTNTYMCLLGTSLYCSSNNICECPTTKYWNGFSCCKFKLNY